MCVCVCVWGGGVTPSFSCNVGDLGVGSTDNHPQQSWQVGRERSFKSDDPVGKSERKRCYLGNETPPFDSQGISLDMKESERHHLSKDAVLLASE